MIPLVLLAGAALAGPSGDPSSLEELDRGDALWFSGQRREGAEAWRHGLSVLQDDEPAIEIMLRVRLLRAGTNLSLFVQGGAIDKATARCRSGAWCELAWVDFQLFAPVAGARPEEALEAARALQDELPVRAASRMAVAGDTSALEQVAVSDRDGLGKAFAEGFRRDRGPALAGLGVVSEPAVGTGGGLHLVHRDVARKDVQVTVDAMLATHGFGISGSIRPIRKVAPVLSGSLQRFRYYDGRRLVPVTTSLVRPGVTGRVSKRVRLEGGPLARWDVSDTGDLAEGHGLWAGSRWSRLKTEPHLAGVVIDLDPDWTIAQIADYQRVGGVASIRGYQPVKPGVLAVRLRSEAATIEGIPTVRVPTVGGAWVHRGDLPGTLRGPWTATLDVEARRPIVDWVWAAVFADVAFVGDDTPHPGGGGGIRFKLPPRPVNTVRFDVGVTDTAWGAYVAWGEAF